MALSVGTGVQCHPSRDTPFCCHRGTREGSTEEKAGMGLEEGFWVLSDWGSILAVNWLGSAFGRSQGTDCWAVQCVHVDPEP